MKRKGFKKPLHTFICYGTMLLLLASCIAKNDVKVKVKRPAKSKDETSTSQPVTVSNIQVVNHQIIITGTNLDSVQQFKIKEGSSNTTLQIESKTATTIVANTISNVTFAAGKILDFIFSNAEAAATFTVNFSLCDSTLGGKAFNCTLTPNDKEVLSYDAASGKWQPRAVNGLSYIGTFDASGGGNPAIKPAGQYYIISVAGDIDAGATILGVGDWIVSNGTSWQKIDNSTVITSVHGRTGVIVGDEGDYNLTQLSDVTLTAPINNQILKYNGTAWVNSDLSALGGGTVTSVSGTAPISVANGTSTPAISISQANTTTNGYLSSADWNTFNSKQASITAGTNLQYYRGDKSWQTLDTLAVPENTNLYFTNARALGVPLTGFATDTNAILATDTILQAFGKAQGQINNLTLGGSNYLLKNGADTVTGQVTVHAATGALKIPTTPSGVDLTDAANVQYVNNYVDAQITSADNQWSENSGDVYRNSGHVGVGTSAPSFPLSIGDGTTSDGAIMAIGLGTGSGSTLAVSGVGTRMFWYPRKAAFRAGISNGDEWDDANIGTSSVAFGEENYASGNKSFSVGTMNESTGVGSFTAGWGNDATGPDTFAIGEGSVASGMAAIAMGTANTASAARSIAMGESTTASGEKSLTAGYFTTAPSLNQVTLGRYNMPKGSENATAWIATDPLFVIGNGTGSGASRSNALMILKNGNVGIGMTAPGSTLDVKGTLRLSGSTSGYVGFAPAAAAGTTTYTLPTAQGTAGQVLSTDGVAGTPTLSWVTPSAAPVTTVHGRVGAVVSANGDYTASQVTNVAAGNIAATDVQAAINELDTEKQSIASFAADVRAVVLTGLSTATNAVIAATDSVLDAFGKLQAQISAHSTSIADKADKTNVTQTITALAVTGLGAPSVGADATNKTYVDAQIAGAANQWTESSGNVYRNSGNVGIGTTTPAHKLQVGGNAYDNNVFVKSSLQIAEDPSTSRAHAFLSTNNSTAIVGGNIRLNPNITTGTHIGYEKGTNDRGSAGIVFETQSAGTGYFRFLTATDTDDDTYTVAEPMTILPSGNVGIGNTSPSGALDIIRPSTSGVPTVVNVGDMGTTVNGAIRFVRGAQTKASMEAINDNTFARKSLVFYTNDAGDYTTDASERMRITSAGNVGIGTASPTSLLHISTNGTQAVTGGKYFVSGETGTIAAKINSTVADNNFLFVGNERYANFGGTKAGIIISPNYGDNNQAVHNYRLQVEKSANGFGDAKFSILSQSYDGTNATNNTRFLIDSSGNVGIGTTTPVTKFDVHNTVATGSTDIAQFLVPNLTDDSFTTIKYGKSVTTGGAGILGMHSNVATPANSYMWFSVQGDAGDSGVGLVIKKGGNVGIGTTSPAASLDVNGYSNTPGVGVMRLRNSYNSGGTKYWHLGPDGNGSGNFVVYNDALAGAYIVYGQTTWSSSSDRRLKKEIEPIKDGLNKVLKLNGVTYKYKKDTETDPRKAGVIAQDVQKVLPEAVTEQDGFFGVKYTELIGLLIESVKDLYHKVMLRFDSQDRAIASKANQSEVEALKAENLSKDKKIKELEKRLLKIEKALSRK